MKTSDIIETLKVFFLDIFGYFAPGFFAILILTKCVYPSFLFESELLKFDPNWRVFLVIFFSYILGYVIYSLSNITDPVFILLRFFAYKTLWILGIMKDRFDGSFLAFNQEIDSILSTSKEVKICKSILQSEWKLNGVSVYTDEEIAEMQFNSVRNIAMSYAPESDIKVYTFMFRSDLCKHLSSFSMVISVLGFISWLLCSLFGWTSFLKTDVSSMIIYFLLLVCSIFLFQTKVRFYKIAMGVPLSIFLSKYFKISSKENA